MFQPQHRAVWGDTVLVYMPKKETGVECLEVGEPLVLNIADWLRV
jgi:hypothetical protein